MSDSECSRIDEAIEYVKVELSGIRQAPYNPRADLTPGDPEYESIKASILNHFMMQPIVYNKQTGNAVGGNQRLKILRDMGVESAVCAVIDVPLEREMEINLALNRIGNMWDQEKLREVMLALSDLSYDMSKTAFSQEEIDKLTQNMDAEISSFFDDSGDKDGKEGEKKRRTYRCPYCGEVFEK